MIVGPRLRPLLAALLLVSCAPEPVPADPAIWMVEGPGGQRGWLFGTIHGLEKPARWKTAEVSAALSQADTLMVEVAGLGDGPALTRTFKQLATTPGQPPLSQRVAPGQRGALAELLKRHGLAESAFSDTETWAVALTLARAETADSKSEYGIDRAVMAGASGKRLVELEGAAGQLRLFDALPEKEQRDLLAAVLADAEAALGQAGPDLAEAWREGEMAVIERETDRGLLADPELREALLTGRNRRWSERVARELAAGRRPFVAVGAAHLAGSEGLPALLSRKGYRVTRLR
jgi:uncharacterized protein